jgi:hypothetical protein
MIEWGCNNGYKYLDLGGTSKDNEGVLNFKSRWGGGNISYPYYYYPKIYRSIKEDEKNILQKYGSLLIKKLPARYLRFIGSPLIKMFG